MGAKDGGKKPGSGFDNYYKSLIIYMVVMLVVTILLNGLIVPSMTKRQIIEVGYNDFLDMVESGQVERVQKDTEEILFLAKYTVASRSASWHNRRKRHEPCQIVET